VRQIKSIEHRSFQFLNWVYIVKNLFNIISISQSNISFTCIYLRHEYSNGRRQNTLPQLKELQITWYVFIFSLLSKCRIKLTVLGKNIVNNL